MEERVQANLVDTEELGWWGVSCLNIPGLLCVPGTGRAGEGGRKRWLGLPQPLGSPYTSDRALEGVQSRGTPSPGEVTFGVSWLSAAARSISTWRTGCQAVSLPLPASGHRVPWPSGLRRKSGRHGAGSCQGSGPRLRADVCPGASLSLPRAEIPGRMPSL